MNALASPLPTGRSAICALVWLVLALALPAQAAEGGGLVLVPDWRMLTALIVGFVLIVFPLNALLFRPIIQALDQRDERIAGTRARAERLAQQTQQVLERYQSAIREAREESERERRARLDTARARMLETTASARGGAEAQLVRAREDLTQTLESARASLRGHADELAREAAARVLGRAL